MIWLLLLTRATLAAEFPFSARECESYLRGKAGAALVARLTSALSNGAPVALAPTNGGFDHPRPHDLDLAFARFRARHAPAAQRAAILTDARRVFDRLMAEPSPPAGPSTALTDLQRAALGLREVDPRPADVFTTYLSAGPAGQFRLTTYDDEHEVGAIDLGEAGAAYHGDPAYWLYLEKQKPIGHQKEFKPATFVADHAALSLRPLAGLSSLVYLILPRPEAKVGASRWSSVEIEIFVARQTHPAVVEDQLHQVFTSPPGRATRLTPCGLRLTRYLPPTD